MHLREIRINGFTSYAGEVSLDNINPGVNVVVGRNGAGKSNFFHAIQFVLGGPAATDLSAFRNFGSRKQVMVEVILANTGQHFYHLGNTVSICRTDDKYLVDGRQVTKSEITALLNAAGLSTDSGSYYIVPQGSIHRLASATDEERFEIMCNASGAASFDERIGKSKANLDAASAKIESSAEIAAKIEPMVNRMARDVENLQERRSLTKQIRENRLMVSKLELMRTQIAIDRESEKRDELQTVLKNSSDELRRLESREAKTASDLADAEAKLAEIQAELDVAQSELHKRKRNTQTTWQDSIDVEMSVNEEPSTNSDFIITPTSSFTSSSGSQMSATYDVSDSDGEEDLDTRLKQLRQELVEHNREVSVAKTNLLNLQLKEGRAKQLSPEQRAEYQRLEVSRVDKTIQDLTSLLEAEKSKLVQLETTRDSKLSELKKARTEAGKLEARLQELNSKQLETERAEAEKKKNSAFLEVRKAEIQRARQVKAAEQQLTLLPSSASSSIEAVRTVARQLNLTSTQYFGTLAEVLDVDPMVADVVDRLAFRQLFYHIVDSSETVQLLVDAVDVSATFVPLQDLVVPALPQYPSESGVSPLIEWVKPLKGTEKVRDLLFGRYLVCEDLKKASEIQSKYNLPTVTLEGDVCDTSGTISGGYSASGDGALGSGELRLRAIKELASIYKLIGDLTDSIAASKATVSKETQRMVQLADKQNTVKVEKMRATIAHENALSVVSDLQESVSLHEKQIADSKQVINDSETELSTAEQQRAAVSNLDSFASALTQTDRSTISQLNVEIAEQTKLCQKLAAEEAELFARKMRRIHKAKQKNSVSPQPATHSEPSVDSGPSVKDLQRSVDRLERDFAKAKAQVSKLTASLSAAHDKTTKCSDLHSEQLAAAHHCTNKIGVLSAFARKLSVNSVDLPEKDSNTLRREVQQLDKQAAKLEKQFAKLAPVDPKVASDREQLVSDLEELQASIKTLTQERDAVLTALETLESQKFSKLKDSLQKISTHFGKIFEQLSGGHNGKLVIKKDSVSLQVSFGDSTAQLSGGQRTVCALAIIFAIQSSDGAPFYIFDEIDSNLDAHARQRVAGMIKTISQEQGVQFICTTFHPELVAVSNACFGVSYDKKKSVIEPIDRKLAIEFTSENIETL